MSDGDITLLYAIAMIVDALTALIVGRAYDSQKKKTARKTGGLLVLVLIPFITVLLPFLTLSYSTTLIITGMVIFGIVMGTHETIMRSAIADIAPFHKRGTSYGVFNTGYGLALLGGSSLMGWFYNLDKIGLIIGLTCLSEFIAILLYIKMNRLVKASAKQ